MHPTKKKTYIDDAIKAKEKLPDPGRYDLKMDWIFPPPHISNIDKSPRVTEAGQIEKYEKKHKFPEPNKYNPVYTLT